jgi:MFS family permease
MHNSNNLVAKENDRAKASFLPIALLFTMTSVALVERAFGPLVPFIRDSLQLTDLQVALAGGAILMGSLIGVIPLGALLGRIKSSISIPINLILIAVVCLAIASQSAFFGLLAGLVLLGISRSGIVPAVNKAIARRYPSSQRGFILGIVTVGGPIGGVIAGFLLPILASGFGWRTGFIALGIITTLTAILPRLAFRAAASEPFEKSGRIGEVEPGFWKKILWIGASFFFISAGIYAASTFISLFLVDSVHIEPVYAGIFFGVAQAGAASGRLIWGSIADGPFKHRRDQLLGVISLMSCISFLLITLLHKDSRTILIALEMLLIGLAPLASWGVLFTLLADLFEPEYTSFATAIILAISWGGGVCGPILFGYILEHLDSYNSAFYSLAILSLVSSITIFLFPTVQPPGIDMEYGRNQL